ncbi:hypothetical protein U1Q18_025517, partial [Sarracenia purpurea var. burkii]
MAPRRRADKRPSVSFDNTRFISKDAEDRFHDHYANCPLCQEKTVLLSDFLGSPVPGWFERRGWTPLLLASGDVCLDLVREFYANLVPTKDEDSFTSYVRGHEIYMAGVVMSEFLKIHDPVIFNYPSVPSNANYHLVAENLCGHRRPWFGGTLPQHELTPEYRLLNLIVSSTIHPRGHVSDINLERG